MGQWFRKQYSGLQGNDNRAGCWHFCSKRFHKIAEDLRKNVDECCLPSLLKTNAPWWWIGRVCICCLYLLLVLLIHELSNLLLLYICISAYTNCATCISAKIRINEIISCCLFEYFKAYFKASHVENTNHAMISSHGHGDLFILFSTSYFWYSFIDLRWAMFSLILRLNIAVGTKILTRSRVISSNSYSISVPLTWGNRK